MPRKKGIKAWLKRNKEGALIGGGFGLLINFQATLREMFAEWMIPSEIAQVPIGLILVFIIPTIVYAIVGAFIDSIWRPDK